VVFLLPRVNLGYKFYAAFIILSKIRRIIFWMLIINHILFPTFKELLYLFLEFTENLNNKNLWFL